MTLYSSSCGECGQHCDWVDTDFGHGHWVHHQPSDHEPQIHWQPMERINDQGEWETM